MVSETCSFLMPARSTKAESTVEPRSCAGVLAKDPPKLPTAVLAAEAITISIISRILNG